MEFAQSQLGQLLGRLLFRLKNAPRAMPSLIAWGVGCVARPGTLDVGKDGDSQQVRNCIPIEEWSIHVIDSHRTGKVEEPKA